MMFGKDLGKQHVWRKVYDIHGLCSLGCLQIWTLRFFFSQKGLLGSSWSSSCLMPLVRSDVPGQKSGCGSLLQDFSSIESFRGKIMDPNLFGSSWSNYLCSYLSFFPSLAQGSPQGSPGQGWPVATQFQPCWDLCSRLGGPQNQTLRLHTKSFIQLFKRFPCFVKGISSSKRQQVGEINSLIKPDSSIHSDRLIYHSSSLPFSHCFTAWPRMGTLCCSDVSFYVCKYGQLLLKRFFPEILKHGDFPV